jgi:hypothetical protein
VKDLQHEFIVGNGQEKLNKKFLVDMLDRHLEGKTPLQVAEMKFVDPKCGSGTLLIEAYGCLLEWHLIWYIERIVPLLNSGRDAASPEVKCLNPYSGHKNGIEKGVSNSCSEGMLPIYLSNDGKWKLTIYEKKRILLDNIYGFDLKDAMIARHSLHLKMLEDYSNKIIAEQFEILKDRGLLPNLENNITHGVPLIPGIMSKGGLDSDTEISPFNLSDDRFKVELSMVSACLSLSVISTAATTLLSKFPIHVPVYIPIIVGIIAFTSAYGALWTLACSCTGRSSAFGLKEIKSLLTKPRIYRPYCLIAWTILCWLMMSLLIGKLI